MLQEVFNIPVSHQTVLNYAKAAAYYCHRFNMEHKGDIDDIAVGDETYLKIKGKTHYTWFFITSEKKAITAYHLSDNRETVSAITAIKEAARTLAPDQQLTIITDGNPSYTAALHYLNAQKQDNHEHLKIKQIQVIGLKNLDEVSTEYRPFKQIVERLNRTYKHHVRPAAGFSSPNSAMAMTTLFVTHYNFLRPHVALNNKTPIHIPQLKNIRTIQGKWIQILKMAMRT
jgi:transposase-like protein